MGIGWHFFKEGSKKFHDPEFSSAFLFDAATGPLSSYYWQLVPDRQGRERLQREATVRRFRQYTDRAARHYGFNEQQRKSANELFEGQRRVINRYFADNDEDLKRYFLELQRLERMRSQATAGSVDFARQRIQDKVSELRGQRSGWLADLASLANHYEERLYYLATAEQRSAGWLKMRDPGRTQMDAVVKYVITGVGICLMLGLFTRLAGLVGVGFLLTVMGTQPPWAPDASLQLFYYQFVEVLALMLLVAFAAGRYAGLDYVLAAGCCGTRSQKKEATT
jgi:uncharacterized membrane protein YphA (DoxX/SURF4 family)